MLSSLKKGCFSQFENFFVKAKIDYDKGDFDWMIELSTTTKMITIPTFGPCVKLHFLPKDTIHNFSCCMFQPFATTSIAFVVIRMHGEIDSKFELLVKFQKTSCISAICVKLLWQALLIFTSIPQLRSLMVHHAIPMSKLFPLFKLQEKDFMAKYFSERMSMIELLGDLKVFDTFHLSPIGELVGYNEKFQPQEVVVEVVKEVVGDSSCV